MEVNQNKNITIGGTTVKPGQNKLVHINIDRLPTGTLIDIPVYVFNAKKPGLLFWYRRDYMEMR